MDFSDQLRDFTQHFVSKGITDLLGFQFSIESIVLILVLIGVFILLTHSYWEPKLCKPKTEIKEYNGLFFDDPKRDQNWKNGIFLIICILGAIIIWGFIQAPGIMAGSTSTSYNKMTASDFIAVSSPITYNQLARAPENFVGKPLKIEGEILQVDESWGNYVIRLATKKSEYGEGFIGDDLYITYNIDEGYRPLENDIVYIYGLGTGLQEYTTVLGASRTIPSIDVRHISFIKRI